MNAINLPSQPGSLSHLDLIDRFERIRSSAFIPLHVWCELLGVSSAQYYSFAAQGEVLPSSSFENLSRFLGMETQALFSADFDYRTVAARLNANTGIPDPYLQAAHGRMRTTISTLDCLEELAGWRARHEVLRRFGLNDAMLTDPSRAISMRLITDICADLDRRGVLSSQDYFALGAYSVVANQGTELAREYAKVYRIGQLWERNWGDLLPFYEQNCDYHVTDMSDAGCVIEVLSKREVAAELGVRHLGNPQICSIKAGMMACVPGYLGLPFANVVETRCVHRGAARCRFEVDFSVPADRFDEYLAVGA